jgi:hypothetical protein
MNFRVSAIIVAGVLALAWMIDSVRPTSAMPNFAQAYGMDCQVCHSVVPALNAYGRYVQRSGYASLDAKTVQRADPFWVGENPTYDSSSSSWPQAGNLALHTAGFIGNDWTFHGHEWISQNGGGGFTDTLWVTYNNLLHRDGHLFIGKVEAPAPSPFSQFFDLAGFNTPGITVGEHPWPFSSNRWGAKLVYTHKWLTADVGYFGPTGDIAGTGGAGDWSASTEKTVQFHVAAAEGYRPLEVGAYGGTGTFQTSDGLIDRYSGAAGYAQLDPVKFYPGAFVIYERGHDSHPGVDPNTMLPFDPATHTAFTTEIWRPVLGDNVILSYRHEYQDDGLGTITHFNYINGAWLVARHVGDRVTNGLIFNIQASMGGASSNPSGGPTWQGQLWYVTTIGGVKGQ